MKRYFLLAFCAFATFANAFAQSNEQKRTINNFSVIRVKNGINVVIANAKSDAITLVSDAGEVKRVAPLDLTSTITLKGDASILDKVKTTVSKDGVLKISAKKKDLKNLSTPLTVYIPVPTTVESIIAQKNCKVSTKGVLVLPVITLDFSKNSVFEGDIRTNDCFILFSDKSKFVGKLVTRKSNLNFSNGSLCEIEGKSNICRTVFDNNSALHGYNLVTKSFDCIASSGSAVNITCLESFRGISNGSAIIYYAGECKIVYARGRIKKLHVK